MQGLLRCPPPPSNLVIDLQLSLPESGNGLKMTFNTGSQGTVIKFSELIRDLKPVSPP